jgi:DNA polymerase III gamma/tau subunit
LALVRDQLAGGQDASVLFREVGRALRAALYLAIDPELAPVMSDSHRDLLVDVAENFAPDSLSRMLGLWLEQEVLVRAAANRELALEVAALRLARWPSVQRVEEWLAGNSSLEPGAGSAGSASNAGSSASSQSSPAAPAGASGSEARPEDQSAASPAAENSSLEEEASSDPGVILATRVLGGEVVRVRSDGEGS